MSSLTGKHGEEEDYLSKNNKIDKLVVMIKKIVLLLTMMALAIGAEAKGVTSQTAADMAKELVAERVERFAAKVQSVTPMEYKGKIAYYVVQFAPEGWALISADDTSTPLLGYNTFGKFQTEDLPYNLKCQMDIYCEQIIDNAKKYTKQHVDWKSYSTPAHRAPNRAAKIAPLIKVNWNQTGSYMKYCPKTSKGQAVVGCVAVGMAQAMSVAEWPPRPNGDYGYDHEEFGWIHINYDEEPAYNWADIISGENSKDGAARLLWHCGVAVRMDYGYNGSGTQTSYIPSALKKYFSYPNSVAYYSRDKFSNEDWHELILNEIQNGRAVAYSGHDPKKGYGHCFNLDGYDGQWFNVNWGWGGTNNGYFSLDGLHDATMDMDYTSGQGVVIGIRPPSEYPMNILLSSTSVTTGAPAGTIVADIIVESEANNPTYTFTLKGPVNPITHKASTPPFEVKNMKLVTTQQMDDKEGKKTFTMTVKNNENGHELSRNFTINVVGTAGIITTTATNVGETSIYALDGHQLQTYQKGLNVIRQQTANGKVIVHKVIIK